MLRARVDGRGSPGRALPLPATTGRRWKTDNDAAATGRIVRVVSLGRSWRVARRPS
jgi:hypothetical protein